MLRNKNTVPHGNIRHTRVTRRHPADTTPINNLDIVLRAKVPLINKLNIRTWKALLTAYQNGQIPNELVPDVQPFMLQYGVYTPASAANT